MRDILKLIHFFYFVIIIMLTACFHKPISKSYFRTYFGVHVLGWVQNQCKKRREKFVVIKDSHINYVVNKSVLISKFFSFK